ncbi:hypothetical protein PFICI_07855 [Pestalotiopsis fici W106-1]|uniref:Uncharacterized protein n=1 Tax=Pestalotiopsis fici (strain W106-1 / CGMCC3.15140) TaxID=1229662 RepID=W3X571_PESFW|nr:uncharacterized protein PFICI_07855 [Pestalotiopsis fici W106-1]ETS80326.1 hypothetical protein PFICI_07855 [Pestalotiopsis fici W106-1]
MNTPDPPSPEHGSSPVPGREAFDLKHPDPLRMHPVGVCTPPQYTLPKPPPPPKFTPPTARNFSFSVSGLWKSNGNMLRWITEVPSVHQGLNEQLPDTPSQKHPLNHDDAPGGHEGGQHRNKKAKLAQGASTARRRDRILSSTVDAARRLSSGFHNMFSSRPSSGQILEDFATLNIASPAGAPSTPRPREKMRFAVIGDGNSGKTCMLLRWYYGVFNSNWYPTHYDLFNRSYPVDGRNTDLEIWDMAGRADLHQLALLSYLHWDGIFLCFSVNNDRKFNNAQTRWINEIHMHCPGIPIFLVGLKIDTRLGNGRWAPLFGPIDTRVSISEGEAAAASIGAVRYLECSAKTNEGVNQVFDEVIRTIRQLRSGRAPVQERRGMTLGDLMCF